MSHNMAMPRIKHARWIMIYTYTEFHVNKHKLNPADGGQSKYD
jgi:hypothetical protein